MKSAVETLSPTRARLTVEVPFEELKPSLDAAYQKIAKQINVPGFRRGKVPPAVIDRQIGRGPVLDEAINAVVPQQYMAALHEHDLEPSRNRHDRLQRSRRRWRGRWFLGGEQRLRRCRRRARALRRSGPNLLRRRHVYRSEHRLHAPRGGRRQHLLALRRARRSVLPGQCLRQRRLLFRGSVRGHRFIVQRSGGAL